MIIEEFAGAEVAIVSGGASPVVVGVAGDEDDDDPPPPRDNIPKVAFFLRKLRYCRSHSFLGGVPGDDGAKGGRHDGGDASCSGNTDS